MLSKLRQFLSGENQEHSLFLVLHIKSGGMEIMMNNKIKILVLGSQGNLGNQLIEELKEANVGELIAWTRKDCDTSDFVALEKGVKALKPSVVINTVAYNNVDACELDLKEQSKAITLNVKMVDCLAKICVDIDAKLVHFSTNYIFSGEEVSYTENITGSPVNFYGMTKYMGEESIVEKMKVGLDACIIRISNLFGVKGTGESSKPSFFEGLDKVSKMQDFLNVINDEKSCFTYTRDVARKVVEMLQIDNFNGIYHFANTEPVTWYEAAKIFFELQNINIDIYPISGDDFKRSAKRPKTAVLISTRTTPLRSFREAMSEYIKDFL